MSEVEIALDLTEEQLFTQKAFSPEAASFFPHEGIKAVCLHSRDDITAGIFQLKPPG